MTLLIHPATTPESAIPSGAPARPAWRRAGGLRGAVLVGATCALIGTPTAAHELPTYRALVDALVAGRSVTSLLDLALCTKDGSDVRGPAVRGGSRITRFLIPNEQYVAFADTHHTLDPEDRPVVEYIRYRAMPDGSVTVRFARQVGASDEVTPRGQFLCSFTHGIRFVAGEAPRVLPLRTRIQPPVQAPIQDGNANPQQPSSRDHPEQ